MGIMQHTFFLGHVLSIHKKLLESILCNWDAPDLQLNKDNASITEAPFFDLHISISIGFVSSNVYNKRDDFDFDIVNFPF